MNAYSKDLLTAWRAQIAPAGSAAPSPFRSTERAGLIVLFAVLVALRLPAAWTQGRFQDEEATVFLAYAWNFPWADTLFRSFGGYWNLAANGITLLVARAVQGGFLSLEHAPYVTMLAGLLAQLLPAALILTGRAPWLGGKRPRMAMLLLIALAPATEEVMLNVMHVQFHLALCVALIIALAVPATRAWRLLTNTILVLAPLCGPGAIVLLPLLLVRALFERTRGRAAQAAALVLGSLMQLGIFYGASPVRGLPLPPLELLAAMANRLFVLPLAGSRRAFMLAETAPDMPLQIIALAALLVVGVSLLARQAWYRRDGSLWLLAASLVVLLVTLGKGLVASIPEAAFYPYAGPRYNYLPIILLGLVLIAGCRLTSEGKWNVLAVAPVAFFLINGVVHHQNPAAPYAQGPSWRQEVAAWRADHNHPLAVWPEPFVADLSGKPKRCLPPGSPGAEQGPRYCESQWMSYFARPDRGPDAAQGPAPHKFLP